MSLINSLYSKLCRRLSVHNKMHPRFIAGYTAGLYDGKLERQEITERFEVEASRLLKAFTGEEESLCREVAKAWKNNHFF